MGILQKDTDLVWTHKLILRSDDPREVVLTYKKQTDRKQANDESLDGSAQPAKGKHGVHSIVLVMCHKTSKGKIKITRKNTTCDSGINICPWLSSLAPARKSQRNKRQQKQTKSRSWKANVVISARPTHRKIMIFLYIGSLIKNKMENNYV